jgi:hypothetical protein
LKGTIKEMRDSYKNAEHLNDAQTLSWPSDNLLSQFVEFLFTHKEPLLQSNGH